MDHVTGDIFEAMRQDMLRLSESGQDYDRALDLAVMCSHSADRWLRVNALHCFGYIACVYGKLDTQRVLPLLHNAGADEDFEVSAAARDAMDDLDVFLPHA